MTTKGLMDNWYGDEYECNGNCGRCESCEYVRDKKAEDAMGSAYDDEYDYE